ncbi:PREDICTED: protein phosphatase 1 regulatory subunit 12B isoform X6 [Papilio polytes]|uniref:protein phosphatase 1 regulatory subunit 12B isoform X6 n=1 Tax=Papilio polytes TaxID=76194 RepID=UPI00067637A1|nr:PREDICTED: protein phosphatase 1 regulatory subunit 12B isoform X6 [Papilio polytes]
MDSRSSSALFKRAEQLQKWKESETFKQSPNPRHAARIQFSTGTVFLAACKAGDKDEIQRLLNMGADINTPNVDGLTALHQACIDDNMDMVEFLVSHGADVNRRDNEGWTPLHATASCGIDSIARYLIENGSDVAAVNYDGELPIDLADIPESMRVLLRQAIESQGIDCEKCRKAESAAMLTDAKHWAENGYVEVRDPKTGGTPLHVAAAKGYLEVAKTLIENCKVDVNCIDYEGWTPLHAAALWGQKEVATLLINKGANLDIKNYSGQTCVEIVDPKIATFLKEAAMTARRKGLMVDNTRARTGSFKRPQPNPTGEHQMPTYVNGESLAKQAANNQLALRRTHSFETDKTNNNKEKSDTTPIYNSPRSDSSYVTIRRKTFVPPVRDDESETQRKAHAKRVRETRRSTQGVTLDEIKSAEQLVKNKNNAPVEASTSSACNNSEPPTNNVNADTDLRGARASDVAVAVALACVNARVAHPTYALSCALADASNSTPPLPPAPATAAATIAAHSDRRPAWRLRLDPAHKEVGEASTATVAPPPQAATEATVYVRRSPASTATASLNRTEDEKETVKRENEATETCSLGSDLGLCTVASPATQAAQNVIQRRRRSKRRSTGVGQVDFEDSTNDRGASGDLEEENTAIKTESSNWEQPREDTALNYKKLYEDAMLEVKKLQVQLFNTQQKLAETEAVKKEYEQGNNAIMYESDKREKRAMIRKLSEMEEELKQLQTLKAENERLRAENRALTRVVSKLTNSAK